MPIAIIGPSQLKDMQENDRLPVLVDARTRQEYDAGHIPGAVHIDWTDYNARPDLHGRNPDLKPVSLDLWEPGYWGLLDNARLEQFARTLGLLGISNSTPVVVYAGGLASKGTEGRIAWMLLYLGVEQVMLLDGGWSDWLTSGGASEQTSERPVLAQFVIRLDKRRRVSTAHLAKKLGRGGLPPSIDTRSLAEYQGDSYDYQPRTGHLPGSVHLTYESLFGSDGRFLPAADFMALVPAEVLNSPDLVTYCEVGVRASTYALLLEAYSGKVLPVHDGSIMEWGLDRSLPLVRE